MEAEACSRKRKAHCRLRNERAHAWGLFSGKKKFISNGAGKRLARHQDGEVMEALASGGLRKLYLRNLDFYPPIIGR